MRIGKEAFLYCKSLTSVKLPSYLKEDIAAFEYCAALADGIEYYEAEKPDDNLDSYNDDDYEGNSYLI